MKLHKLQKRPTTVKHSPKTPKKKQPLHQIEKFDRNYKTPKKFTVVHQQRS